MLSVKTVENILQNIQGMRVSSREMKDYVNALTEEDFCALATTYNIGRSGWDRTFYSNTSECISYIEECEDRGIRVNDEMLDDKFLTNDLKRELVEIEHHHTVSSVSKSNGVYMHGWLDAKTDLLTVTKKGLEMLGEIR